MRKRQKSGGKCNVVITKLGKGKFGFQISSWEPSQSGETSLYKPCHLLMLLVAYKLFWKVYFRNYQKRKCWQDHFWYSYNFFFRFQFDNTSSQKTLTLAKCSITIIRAVFFPENLWNNNSVEEDTLPVNNCIIDKMWRRKIDIFSWALLFSLAFSYSFTVHCLHPLQPEKHYITSHLLIRTCRPTIIVPLAISTATKSYLLPIEKITQSILPPKIEHVSYKIKTICCKKLLSHRPTDVPRTNLDLAFPIYVIIIISSMELQ